MKLLEIVWNWRRSPIIFSKSFPIMFKKTISQYNLGKSYTVLLSLGIMIIVDDLKWDGQYSKSIQVLAMSISLDKQSSSLMMILIWLQVSLSGPRADKLLHFSIALINSYLENEFHSFVDLLGISSRTWISISCIWAELKELCRAIQRSSSSIHGCPSYWIASIAGSFCFLTQFISSHRLHFLFAISSILSSKKSCFVFLTVLLKLHQFSRLRDNQYLSRDSQYSLFYQALECLVIFTGFKFLCQDFSILDVSIWTISSRFSASWKEDVFTFLMIWMMFLMNCISSLLPFASKCCGCDILSSWIDTSIVIRVWSDESLHSGWIQCWLNSGKDGQRNTKSKTELVLWSLSENLLGMFSIGLEMFREKESAMSKRELLWMEWNR